MKIIKDNLVWIGLVITLLLVYSISEQENDDELAISQLIENDLPQAKAPNKTQVTVAVDEGFILRKHIIDMPINMFSVPITVQDITRFDDIPMPQTIPVNPYTYAGKLIENGEVIVFLTNGRNNYAVKKGDTIEDAWQVKSIHSTEMILHNLSTHTQITVQIGALL